MSLSISLLPVRRVCVCVIWKRMHHSEYGISFILNQNKIKSNKLLDEYNRSTPSECVCACAYAYDKDRRTPQLIEKECEWA